MNNCETCPHKNEGVCCSALVTKHYQLQDKMELLREGKSVLCWDWDYRDAPKAGDEFQCQGLKLHVTESELANMHGKPVQRLTVRQVGVVR